MPFKLPFVIVGTDPAVDIEIAVTLAAGFHYKVLSVAIPLVTDANAANRDVLIVFTRGSDVLFSMSTNVAITASLTVALNYAVGVPLASDVGLNQTIPLPEDLWLTGADTITTITTNRQATDNFGAPVITVDRRRA